MDQKDNFSHWIKTVEAALSNENRGLEESLPLPENTCGCGAWDCTVCFPAQEDEMYADSAQPHDDVVFGGIDLHGAEPTPPEMPQCDAHDHEIDSALEMGMNDIEADMMSFEEVSDQEHMNTCPEPIVRSKSGHGVKLGDIVTKTEFRRTGGNNSPLTYGEENLKEAPLDFDDSDFDAEEEWEMGSPLSRQEYLDYSEQIDPDEALDMIEAILYMQDEGLSQDSRRYSKEELSDLNMSASKLKNIYARVTGKVAENVSPEARREAGRAWRKEARAAMDDRRPYSPVELNKDGKQHSLKDVIHMLKNKDKGTPQMENVDKDVAAMLQSLKKYDMLAESVAPVLGMKTVTMEKSKPDFLDLDKDGDKKEPMKQAARQADKKTIKENYSTLDLWNMSPKEVIELLDAGKITHDDFHAYQDLVIAGGPDEGNDYTDYTMRKGEMGDHSRDLIPGKMEEDADKSKIPAALRKSSGKEGWKVTQKDLDKEEEKKISSKKGLEKLNKEHDLKEGADQEVLEWMNRFAKLGTMKGYGK